MPQDPGNPGPQNFDSRKTLETQDLKIWICIIIRLDMIIISNQELVLCTHVRSEAKLVAT